MLDARNDRIGGILGRNADSFVSSRDLEAPLRERASLSFEVFGVLGVGSGSLRDSIANFCCASAHSVVDVFGDTAGSATNER